MEVSVSPQQMRPLFSGMLQASTFGELGPRLAALIESMGLGPGQILTASLHSFAQRT